MWVAQNDSLSVSLVFERVDQLVANVAAHEHNYAVTVVLLTAFDGFVAFVFTHLSTLSRVWFCSTFTR